MTEAVSPAHNDAVLLGAMIFDQVTSLSEVPSDGVYADCLISLAFNHLATGLQANPSPDQLVECASAIEGCAWLSTAVRSHVSRTLRALAVGRIPHPLAAQIVLGALNRSTHGMVIDCMRAIGSDGLGDVANALTAGEVTH